ncbi:hypothetical protein F7725_024786 [Dissostichus mawsoni]|uniref:PID domain-containing protein n=1 Tax=Dissostichus mawsoni TaxID=36200 RepID=A0A7J5X9B6_DISMA|nr:hypothetical protein F7725_024786 [Dissostichus mawsoni]
MDALKSAGRAIIRSPSMAKQSWTAGRHRKLPENWTDTRETIVEGMTFNLRHLGMTLAKAMGKKPQKVALKISPQGILLFDSLSNKQLENVSIYRISYCTVDKLNDKVFAYIAQNTLNGTLECHAYLCSKRKVAQAVALTVAQAFTIAFELWQVAKEAVLWIAMVHVQVLDIGVKPQDLFSEPLGQNQRKHSQQPQPIQGR